MSIELLFMSGFIIFVTFILFVDLKIIGKNSHVVGFKEALVWSIIWVFLSFLFYFFLLFFGEKVHGIENMSQLNHIVTKYAYPISFENLSYEQSIELFRKSISINYLTGYFIEKTLSIDNIFVILMILKAFSVKAENYKPVLFWGIIGAIVLRCLFIFAGSALVNRFEWILYIFGLYLVYAGIKMFIDRKKEHTIEPKDHFLVKYLSKHFNVHQHFEGKKFWLKINGKTFITPLFIILILIEFSDLIFALDSIPAIFSITRDPYIVFFSNILAILGLRSLFFLLIKVVDKFHLLPAGISILLVYVGIKLLAEEWLEHIGFKTIYSLYFIAIVLVGSIVLSIIFPKKEMVAKA